MKATIQIDVSSLLNSLDKAQLKNVIMVCVEKLSETQIIDNVELNQTSVFTDLDNKPKYELPVDKQIVNNMELPAKETKSKMGRPPIDASIVQKILEYGKSLAARKIGEKIRQEGYTVADSTISNIMKKNGLKQRIVRQKNENGKSCPHCNSTDTIKRGFNEELDDGTKMQRYKCKSCEKDFNDKTGTPMERKKVSQEVRDEILRLKSQGLSLREIESNLKSCGFEVSHVGISNIINEGKQIEMDNCVIQVSKPEIVEQKPEKHKMYMKSNKAFLPQDDIEFIDSMEYGK